MAPNGQESIFWNMVMNRDGDDAVHPVDRLHAELGVKNNAGDQKVLFPQKPVRSDSSGQRKPRTRVHGKSKQKSSQPKLAQKPVQQGVQQQEVRTWFANVFQKFYGAGVGEPNGYQYRVEKDPQTGARQIRIFQDPNDATRSFVFVEQPSGLWELRSGTGQPIMGNVHYDPKQRRFFALGVSEDDVLKALQQSISGQPQQSKQDSDAGKSDTLPPGVAASFRLGDGSVFTVGVDGMARVLRPLGNNQWAVVMERPLQELLNPQPPAAGSAQSDATAQSSEQIPSWMLLLLTLFLLMGRR